MKFDITIADALETARTNLTAHIVELKQASAGWTELVKAELDRLQAAVDRDGVKVATDALHKLFYSRPVDNRANYSKLIGAMEQAVKSGQSTVQMDEEDYDRVFNDNWDWRVASKLANASYSRP